MPCYVDQTEPHFPSITPVKHGFSIKELLGHADAENPATFGIFNVDQGPPISFDKTPAHLFVTVTEGELTLEDLEKPGATIYLKAGDVFHVVKDSSIKWSSSTSCKGTYVLLKPLGDMEFLKGFY